MSRSRHDLQALVAGNQPNGGYEESAQSCDPLEYKIIVGYLGTIEMPTPIASSSRLQTVRSCIKKMRQEKRQPSATIMTILPNCLILRNGNNQILATYAANRLSYISNGICTPQPEQSDRNRMHFGLITTAYYSSNGIMLSPDRSPGGHPHTQDVIVSNSCHVFMVDPKLVDHQIHYEKMAHFKINCTRDPISSLCLEFPRDSDYVVNLIRSMYAMINANDPKAPRMARVREMHSGNFDDPGHDLMAAMAANSPQPSNHSELTTTSSNSDSGIGFHNDCTNISDRILVVDFPGLRPRPQLFQQQQPAQVMMGLQSSNFRRGLGGPSESRRPCGIFYEQDLEVDPRTVQPNCRPETPPSFGQTSKPSHRKSKSVDLTNCDAAQAMPPPRLPAANQSGSNTPRKVLLSNGGRTYEERAIDVPANVDSMLAAPTSRSCDNLMRAPLQKEKRRSDAQVFRVPKLPASSCSKSAMLKGGSSGGGSGNRDGRSMLNLINYKLSPKLFGGLGRPISQSCENLRTDKKARRRNLMEEVNGCAPAEVIVLDGEEAEYIDIWGSLQEVNTANDNPAAAYDDMMLMMDGVTRLDGSRQQLFHLDSGGVAATSEPNLNSLVSD